MIPDLVLYDSSILLIIEFLVFAAAYSICVEDFMTRNVKYIWYKMSYRELREVLRESKKLRSLPIVDSKGERVAKMTTSSLNSLQQNS